MRGRRILVRVSPQGGILVEAEGFQGRNCTDATKAFEEALGSRISRSHKAEYLKQACASIIHQQLGGGGE